MKLMMAAIFAVVFGLSFLSPQESELSKSIARGKGIYTEVCITCHMGKGEGAPPAFPPLAKSDYMRLNPTRAIAAVKFGQKGKIRVNGKDYDNMMPPPGLANNEVADVMNYIMNSWGNTSKKMVTVQMVDAVKESK